METPILSMGLWGEHNTRSRGDMNGMFRHLAEAACCVPFTREEVQPKVFKLHVSVPIRIVKALREPLPNTI